VGFAASFVAAGDDSSIPIPEMEVQDAQSGNASSHSSLVLRRTLENRHHCATTRCSPRRGTPCLADRLISSGTGPAPLHYRSLRGVRAGDLKELSATAGHTHFSDGPRSRLYRKRRAVAARGGTRGAGVAETPKVRTMCTVRYVAQSF